MESCFARATILSIHPVLKEKRKLVFIKRKCNHAVFSRGQFYCFHPVQKKQKKRKLVFIKRKWNHVVFSKATILSFQPVPKEKRKLVFIKRKWNHVVFSRAIILSIHPVLKEKKNWFSLNGNVIMPSLLGDNFIVSTLYKKTKKTKIGFH